MHIKKTFNPEKNQLFLAIFLTLFLAFSFPALAETGAGTDTRTLLPKPMNIAG